MRNKEEQINYILKRRSSGMSDKDFREELEKLYSLGHNYKNTDILYTDYYREWDF